MRPARQFLQTLAKLARSAHTDRRGVLVMSASQIIEQSGYGETWGRKALHMLEDMGVIEWERGGIVDGKPQPSRLRIIKTVLRRIREAAKPTHDETERRRSEAFARRLMTIRNAHLVQRRYRSPHLSASDSPTYSVGRWGREATAPTPSPKTQNTSPITDKENTMATTNTKGMPESVRLTRLRDQYMRTQGITSPEDVAYAHRHMATVQDWDRKIAAARRLERRPEEDLTDAQLW